MDELIQGTSTTTSLLSTKKQKKNQSREDVAQSDGIDKEISDKTVNVSQSRELLSLLTDSAESSERAKKVAEIAKLVQSGKYFSSRKITDIAAAVDRRLDESVSTFSLLLGDDK
jgi:anti-sigma28 factor (negative regulator of flagellin synthesis)